MLASKDVLQHCYLKHISWIDSMMQFRIKDAIVKLDETIDIVESALGELLQEDVTGHFGKT